MSDQQSSSPPPKPKPGSLRDRIAAFEKSATAPVSAGQAPPARPKPSGFASWKPKVPSPPSSPSSKILDHAASPSLKATGTMSASDAKESITKGGGGSLKDRMAALQGKGAFGAPSPPLAPKPAVEKPKWKPPPAVAAPIDNDSHDGAGNTTGDEPPAAAIASTVAATLDRTRSPPVSRASLDLSPPIAEGEPMFTAEPTTSTGGDIEGVTDPEEEERQRRAAIAARMARLGGARLGMAPPVAKKPMPIRKPTREDPPKRQSILEGNVSPNAEQGATDSPHVQPQSDVELSPVRKNSENASLLSVDSTDSRSPPSMPVPMVPRRAGPPRKKPVKPPSEVYEERVEEAIAISPIISTVDELEHKTVEKAIETPILAPEHEDFDYKDHRAEIHDEPQSIDSYKPAEELVTESKSAGSGESREQGPAHDAQSPPLTTIEASDELKQEHKEHEPVDSDQPHQPDDVDRILKNQAEDDEIIDYSDEHSDYDENSVEHHDHQHLQEEEDDAEEEARRKRVAERLAKMGGINPFAAPLLSPTLRPSLEETGHAGSPVVSSYAAPASVALPASPSRPDIPTKRTSLPFSHEVVEPHPLPVVESKVEETQGERELSDEIEDEDSDYAEEGSSDETRIRKAPMEASLAAYELSPPPPPPPLLQHHQQVRQLSDPIRPPIPRPHVQIQQYGRHDAREEHSTTRPSRLPDPPVSYEEAPLSPTRPAQPPRRIVPQAPEEQEQEDEEEAQEEAGTDDEVVPSHLFVRSHHPGRGGQRYEVDDDGNGSDDTPALPVLQRRSMEVPPGRALPPPLPPPIAPPSHLRHHLPTSPSYVHEPDSDHDGQALPVRPRHSTVPPTPTSPTRVLPRPIPRRSVPSAPDVPSALENEEYFHGMPSVAVSEPEPGEILDEEEGDPIDPAFHSPSRQASVGNMRASAQDDTSVQAPSVQPVDVEKHEEAQPQQQEQDQTKRQTLAERMAKLGGIKFGAAPIPAAVSRPPPTGPPVSQEGLGEEGGNHPQADAEDVEQPVEPSEEEEERARKERIAAKLSGMGGMRIGMMPMGMGLQRAHTLRDENVAPPSPTRAVPPPVRPPPPTLSQSQDTDSERISDDGVKVEAEESEMEEVDYVDVAEEFEEIPPPIPSRGGRRRESTDLAEEFEEMLPPLPTAKQPAALSHKPRSSELQLSADDLMAMWGRVGVQVCEVATSLYENSKKTLIGDGTYAGFITAVLAGVPNAAPISVASGEYGYLIYAQNGSSVQKRASEIMPGDIVEIHEGKLKGHKGIQTYHQNVGGSGQALLGVVGEFEAKKWKIRVFHANQHVGQQTVESVSYRLEDLKSGTVKVYRVLEE